LERYQPSHFGAFLQTCFGAAALCATVLGSPVHGRQSPYYIGADISWLPEKEAAGVVYSDALGKRDLLLILKDHGFNAIRLRIFHNPSAAGGYSSRGFCDLNHTLAMAKRVKASGMALMIDFHYSDTWADPAHQITPLAWRDLAIGPLRDSVAAYTGYVISKLVEQNTVPDMVQIGNEINPGFMLPVGGTEHFDQLATLFKAGASAVKSQLPQCKIILHLASGNDNAVVKWYVQQLQKNKAEFDVIGLSCYTEWHGAPSEWKKNLDSLVVQFPDYDLMIAEYSHEKERAVLIPFQLPNERGLGSFIWEPTDFQEKMFVNGKANALLDLYPNLAKQVATVSLQAHSSRQNGKKVRWVMQAGTPLIHFSSEQQKQNRVLSDEGYRLNGARQVLVRPAHPLK
jgi:arabinogalactan endo-1,4-beta-galactosidase